VSDCGPCLFGSAEVLWRRLIGKTIRVLFPSVPRDVVNGRTSIKLDSEDSF
jgi:hypothetical protein